MHKTVHHCTAEGLALAVGPAAQYVTFSESAKHSRRSGRCSTKVAEELQSAHMSGKQKCRVSGTHLFLMSSSFFMTSPTVLSSSSAIARCLSAGSCAACGLSDERTPLRFAMPHQG